MQEPEDAPAMEPVPTEPKPEQPSPAPEVPPPVAPQEPAPPAEPAEVDIMSIPQAAIVVDPALTARLLVVMSGKIEEAQRRKKSIDTELADLNRRNEWLKQVQARQPVPKAPPPFKAIHDQIHRDSVERAERREALKGISTRDLRDLTRTGSKLDEDLRARRRGVEVPAARVPANA